MSYILDTGTLIKILSPMQLGSGIDEWMYEWMYDECMMNSSDMQCVAKSTKIEWDTNSLCSTVGVL